MQSSDAISDENSVLVMKCRLAWRIYVRDYTPKKVSHCVEPTLEYVPLLQRYNIHDAYTLAHTLTGFRKLLTVPALFDGTPSPTASTQTQEGV
jgi:hypothetical protein